MLIDNASNVVLDHDYVGIDTANNATGIDVFGNVIYEGNGVYGVTIQSENGGAATGDVLSSDIVSANTYNGIILSGTGTTKNVVSGTIIGSDNTGAAVVDDPGNALGNGQHGGGGSGVVINGGASYNTIGGTTAASRDVILGNRSYGVYITDGNTVHNVDRGRRHRHRHHRSALRRRRRPLLRQRRRRRGDRCRRVLQRRQRHGDGPRGHLGQCAATAS